MDSEMANTLLRNKQQEFQESKLSQKGDVWWSLIG
jgi:hypothetical protein